MVMEKVVATVTIEVMEILYVVSIIHIQHVMAQLKMYEVVNHNQILLESLTLVRLGKH